MSGELGPGAKSEFGVLDRWASTVLMLKYSSRATSLFDRPSAMRAATRVSIGVSPGADFRWPARRSSSVVALAAHKAACMPPNRSSAPLSVSRAAERWFLRRSTVPKASSVRPCSSGSATRACSATARRRDFSALSHWPPAASNRPWHRRPVTVAQRLRVRRACRCSKASRSAAESHRSTAIIASISSASARITPGLPYPQSRSSDHTRPSGSTAAVGFPVEISINPSTAKARICCRASPL